MRTGWFYVGNGQLRYRTAAGWTDDYKPADYYQPDEAYPPRSAPAPARRSFAGSATAGLAVLLVLVGAVAAGLLLVTHA
ncbi:MAG TPA: hypothetical protein VFJ94_01050 [Intrasporangium sp.]|nr:hypothetical protein [Intrasporangium sp.]